MPVLSIKLYWNGHSSSFTYYLGLFTHATTDLSSYDRDHMVYTAEHMYYLVLPLEKKFADLYARYHAKWSTDAP